MSSTDYNCPYAVGAEFFLLLTTPRNGGVSPAPQPIRVRVIELFPFTQSQTMKVALRTSLECPEISSIVILKLYDRRYLEERVPTNGRTWGVWNLENERKATEMVGRKSRADDAADKIDASEAQHPSINCTINTEFEEDDFESKASETELEYQLARDESPVDYWLVDERFRHRTRDWFHNETEAYSQLQRLQNQCIPRFFGTVIFDENHLDRMPPGIQLEVQGILIEFIDGISVDEISPNSPLTTAHPSFGSEAVDAFRQINLAGVIHGDLRLANLRLRSGDGRIFVIDFAHARFRKSEESDERWARRIRYEREPSAIGDFTGRILDPKSEK